MVYAQQTIILSGAKDPVTVISAKVLKEAYQRLNIDVQLENYPSARSLAFSNQGITGGEVGRIQGIDNDYPNLLRVPVVINIVEGVLFSKEKISGVIDWQDLEHYVIGIKRGDIFIEKGTESMNVVPVDDARQLMSMLEKDRTDIVVLAKMTGLTILKELNLKNIITIKPAISTVNLYHYLHKKNSALLPQLTTILREMAAEGRITEIRAEAISELLAQ